MQGINTFIRQHRDTIAAEFNWAVGTASGDLFDQGMAARRALRRLSVSQGGGESAYLFTTQVQSAKLIHNETVTEELEQVVMYLLPHRLSGLLNVCTHSSRGCRKACLHSAGRLGLPPAELAKYVRTMFLAEMPWHFIAALCSEIAMHQRRVAARGRRLVVRMNGTSDVPWERFVPELFDLFSDVLFQDYTKDWSRIGQTPDNYYLVASATENDSDDKIACHSGNVVVPVAVRRGDPLPDTMFGRTVIDGDLHDLRLIDPQDRNIVAVRAKGDGVGDTSGFIRQVVMA